MKTTSYQTLIDSRSKYEAMLKRLNIKDKRNRWTMAYDLVNQLEAARQGGTIDNIPNMLMGRIRFALTDLDNMLMILDQFAKEESDLFKKKFIEMLKGSDSQASEISTDRSRDAQLELMMCARFREVGLDAQLCDPHPDILIRVNSRKYGFECKRIFSTSDQAVQKHVKKAINQLNDNFLDDDFTKRGIPLLCIDRHITGGNKVLDAKDEEASRKQLGHEIEQFINKHRRHWAGLHKAKQERVIGVMIYINMTTILKVEAMQVVSQQSGANNSGWTRWGEQMFQEFIDDIAQHLGPINQTTLN